jgi:hypothetical protein
MAVPTPPPLATPTPLPPPSPAPTASPAPSAAPTLLPLTYVITPPAPAAGGPAITQIAMSDHVVHSGAPYLLIVMTTPDVTGVTVEAYGARFSLFPAGPGRFGVTGQVPSIPFLIANRTVEVRFVATAPGGTYTTSFDVHVGR